MDIVSFILSMNTKDIIEDLKIFKDMFHFSILDRKMNYSEKK